MGTKFYVAVWLGREHVTDKSVDRGIIWNGGWGWIYLS